MSKNEKKLSSKEHSEVKWTTICCNRINNILIVT